MSTELGRGMLVLDEHDLVYAYGPVDAIETVLLANEYESGDPSVPSPHEHNYLQEFDADELRIAAMEWRRVLPLGE